MKAQPLSNNELLALALVAGWTYRPAMLYDEDGIDGYIWNGPNGREVGGFAIDGDWSNGPEVPDEVRRELLGPTYEEQQRSADINRFAAFLESLLGLDHEDYVPLHCPLHSSFTSRPRQVG